MLRILGDAVNQIDSLAQLLDSIALGNRSVIRWRYRWGDGRVRGVDVMRIRIVVKLKPLLLLLS